MKPNWTPIKIKLGQITAWEHNPRMSNKAQAQRLIESEKHWGQPMTFAVSPFEAGRVFLYDGHQRYSAWLTVYGADYEVDARQCDRFLTEEERLEFVVTMHAGATGSWDWQKLSSFPAPKLIEMGFDGDKLKDWNNNANNLKELLNSEQVEPVDAPAEIDRAAELQVKWQTASGQLWKLGEHRLLIGDCTVRENVERLMGGEVGMLFETDPPYGVDYVEKARYMDALGYGHSQAATQTDIEGDGGLDAVDLFKRTLDAWKPYIQKCAFYIWHSDRYRIEFEQLLKDLGVHVHETIIWVKPNFVISRMDYHPKHEPCLYGWIEAHKFSGERNQTTLWEIGRENDKIHPTQKPIEVFEIPMKNNTAIGDICIEPFAGSGSQIIAAHNLNRRCYAMEISEKYGAVILERFFQATGIQPELVTE